MNRRLLLSFAALALLLASSEGLRSLPAQAKEKTSKPLTGYTVINVEKFAVGTLSSKEGFPQDFEKVMQKTAVEKMAASKLFEKVIDSVEPAAAEPTSAPPAAEETGHVILAGTIIGYDPGNQTTRALLCCGAGASKVKVRFIFRDAQTGKEIYRTDLQGSYAGTWNVTGGSSERGTRKSAEQVVDRLIKEIHKNR